LRHTKNKGKIKLPVTRHLRNIFAVRTTCYYRRRERERGRGGEGERGRGGEVGEGARGREGE
jgi:hypothetical protein